MDIIMFILLVVLVPVVVKDRVLPWWRNHRQQSCCVSSGSHSSSADPPQSQQPRRRRRIRDRVPSGRRRRTSGRNSGGNTATGAAGTASSTTSSKRTRWLPSWQQIAASLVIVALLLGNVIQAFKVSGLDDRIDDLEERSNTPSAVDADSPYAAGDSDDGNAAQTASGSNDPEVVEEECASQAHFYARDTRNGYWGPQVSVKTHQAALEVLEERVCKDPALLTGLRTRFGLNELEFAVDEQVVERAHAYIDDRGHWRSAVDELMAHIRSQTIRLGLETGRYETFFMDTSRGDVPWIFQDVRTAGERKVLRVGDIDLQLLCGFQPRSAAPAPTRQRQSDPTQPAPEHDHDHGDEPPSRQVRQEPPSEEEPERDQPSDDTPKIRVCDIRNGEIVIVQLEHAREFSHFKREDHPACQQDEPDNGDDADDGDDEVADKPDQSRDCQHGNPGAQDCPEDETDERQDPDGSDHPDSEPEGSTEDPKGEQLEEPDESVVEDTTEEADPPDNDPEEVPESEGGSDADAPSDGIVELDSESSTASAG